MWLKNIVLTKAHLFVPQNKFSGEAFYPKGHTSLRVFSVDQWMVGWVSGVRDGWINVIITT